MPLNKVALLGQLDNLCDRMDETTDENREKVAWDAVLDLLEYLVEHSKTKIDDIIVKPLIAIFRRRFDIPD